ncbi:MAG TPA: zf-HC2 domain-containing protein [Gemmatimonadaceae bacterium]
MNDCLNAEMRDRLPELLHDRLPANVRAELVVHVAACADCREELELLRALRSALAAPAPRVDVASIVSALPKAPSQTLRPRSRRTWSDWRIAATITILAVGGSSVVLINRTPHVAEIRIDTARPAADSPATALAPTAGPNAPSDASQDSEPSGGLGMSGHLADLDDAQVEALINEIENMKAVPITEPEPVSMKVGLRNASDPGTD